MATEADGRQPHGELDEGKFGKAIGMSILVGTPIAIIVVVLALWIFTDSDLAEAFSVGVWPGLLTGVFGGGFIGVIIGSD